MTNSADTATTPIASESRWTLSRWQASGLHLAISVGVAALVVAAMLLLWFPAPYFEAMGGSGLLYLIVGIDVVLGPLITLIIFDTKKKSLKLDLACVVFVQVVALAYGVSTMFLARPVYTVFNRDRFDVVVSADIDAAEHAKVTNPLFKFVPITGPKFAALVSPNDKRELERVIFSGTDLRAMTQHYVAYDLQASLAGAESKTVSKLKSVNPASAVEVERFLSTKGIEEGKVGYLPVYTRNKDMTMIVMRDTGAIVGMVPVAPN